MKNIFLKISFFNLSFLALFNCSCNSDYEKQQEVVVDSAVVIDPQELTPQNATNYIVDKKATKETVALFYNLKKLAKTKVAIGQQAAFNSFYKDNAGDSDIKKNTGYDPAVLGSDFMFITDKNNTNQTDNWFYQQEQKIITDTKAAYAKGMINTFSWHLRAPNNEDTFYTDKMTAEQKATAFKSILPGGAHHEWYKKKLDKIAGVFLKLKGSKGELIPVIFRLFHEFDGNWFWWGANFCTAEEYKMAYQFTVEYLRDTKKVHNILYAFSPDNTYTTAANYLSRYPGDAYVDVLGMDNYGDLDNKGQSGADLANSKLKIVSDLAKSKTKVAALTETGYQLTAAKAPIADWFSNYLYTTLNANAIEISYAMLWNNDKDGYYVPNATAPNASDFKTFATKPKSALLNLLPKMYEMPK